MKQLRPFALWLAVLAASAAAPPALGQDVPRSREQIELSFAPLVARTAPAVVNIFTTRVVRQRVNPLFNDPFFRRFFGDRLPRGENRRRVQNSLGSGVILDASGLIVTNHHVIENADEIRVVLNDRREFAAEILLSDERTDIAVLRVDPPGGASLPTVRIGDSDALEVGDLVLAIGNPFGVGQTVTGGIVSALARTEVGVTDFRSFIQTDAAINPGNSGGALVAMDGSLVGINTAIFSRSGGSLGIGFAVPSSMVRAILEAAREGRPLTRPWLGFSGRAVDQELAEGLGLDRPVGVIVDQVAPGGPADRAGLDSGDVVIAADGREVVDGQELRFRLATRRIGERVGLTVLRRGDRLALDIPLEPPPEEPPRNATRLPDRSPLAGAVALNLSPAVVEEMGLAFGKRGVMLAEVPRASPARRYGFRPGDVILAVNDREIGRVRDLVEVMARGAQSWAVLAEREGRRLSFQLR